MNNNKWFTLFLYAKKYVILLILIKYSILLNVYVIILIFKSHVC